MMADRMAMVRLSVRVLASVDQAFTLFTADIDRWYVKNRDTLGAWAVDSSIRLEPGIGGRLLHQSAQGECRVIARVVTWEPGRTLGLVDSDGTEVDVTFVATESGARVTLEHRGLERFAAYEPRIRFGWRVVLPWFADHVRHLHRSTTATEEP